MRIILFFLFLFFMCTPAGFSQITFVKDNPYKKGNFYIYWGWNRAAYSNSDIHFKGDNYDFTLHNVAASDKPKGWQIDYINPARMTIPQTNLRIGYFINDHYNISIGFDHMKYVMNQNQIVNITGEINDGTPFDGIYDNDPITLTEEFLTFEHTDGLNYVNTEISRVDDISKWFNISNTDKFQLNITEGIGGGFLYPKTNAMLLGKERHDDFNVAGYGVSAKIGLNFTFFKHFFIQTELKGGYIDMNNIKTTHSSSDSASQHFYFLQRIIAFGGIFKV